MSAATSLSIPVGDGTPVPAGDALTGGITGQGRAVVMRHQTAPPPPVPGVGGVGGDWAVCCSGGGIRSATYCLGGLQSLDEGELLGTAKWIIGVSGGSYIAASRALVAHGLRRAQDARSAGPGERPGRPHDSRRAYARGTPEEQNLRNNTRYLAPDAKTVLVAVLSLLLGSAVTCLLVIAPLYALAHVWGWLLRGQGVLTWAHGTASASVTGRAWCLAPALAAAITVALFGYWWATLVSGGPARGACRARAVGWAAAVTAVLALLMLGAPPLIAWLYDSAGPLGTVARFAGFHGPGRWSPAAFAGVVAAVTTVARLCQRQLARMRTPAAPAYPRRGSAASAQGMPGRLATWARVKLTPWLASLAILAAGAFATLLWIGNGAWGGFSTGQVVRVAGAVAVMLATRAVADINRTSLHDFYRWRLADAYAVTRDAIQAGTAAERAELFAEAARTRLSELRADEAPTPVIATTANINANREVPAGRGGFCLAFAPDTVSLRADPRCGEPDVEASTADYEHLLGHTRLTVFDVVAISGAAFSPLMGAATRGAYRLLLTLTNLRLGVWMPHPAVVRSARDYLSNPPEERDRWWARHTPLLLLWYVSQHWFWRRDPGRQELREKLQSQREARLWAHVLMLRQQSGGTGHPVPRRLARLRAAVCWRVMQPTLGMLWAEAAGHTSYRATWINVTDGGHYDNLGLVEALRRGAANVIVFDASGDRPETWFTLGGAMALARTDAGVEISLDPTTMARNCDGAAARLARGEVLRPWAHGTFTRLPGGLADRRQPAAGNLWVCKLGWWKQAPWDVSAYAAGHPGYPCDSTLEQLYDGTEFEAYHALGAAAVFAAAAGGGLPLLLPDRYRPAPAGIPARVASSAR